MALFSVFGNPIGHSVSPQIHQAFAQQTGITLRYTRSLVSLGGFRHAVARFFREGGGGANVTLPFKEHAFALATHVTQRAERAGAVNTLVPLGYGQLLGDNTDGIGLVHDLTQNLKQTLAGRTVVLLGAGGAARGVIDPLLAAGVEQLVLANRTVAKAEAIVADFNQPKLTAHALAQLEVPAGALVINATSSSLAGADLAIAREQLAAAGCVYDMMYAAQPTRFMQQAMSAGVTDVYDGLGMLVEQAAVAFKLWHTEASLNTGVVINQLRAKLREKLCEK